MGKKSDQTRSDLRQIEAEAEKLLSKQRTEIATYSLSEEQKITLGKN